jgi:four helix bundle protein
VIGDELRARTRQFALDVIELCLNLGSDDLAKLIRPQLLRAGTGVAANHRSASRPRSRRDFIAKLSVVIEEADESELWLDVLETRRFGPLELVIRLRREARELRAIFVTSRRTAIKRRRKRQA